MSSGISFTNGGCVKSGRVYVLELLPAVPRTESGVLAHVGLNGKSVSFISFFVKKIYAILSFVGFTGSFSLKFASIVIMRQQ